MKYIKTSENNLTLNADGLIEHQWEKLKRLLTYAYENCPFYHKKYDCAGIRPEDINDFGDFQKLPVLTKAEIREELDNIVPVNIDRNLCEEIYTGGTTGIPLKIYRDRRKHDLMTALYLRTIRLWGCDLGSKIVWIWGLPKGEDRLYDFDYCSKFIIFFKNVAWFNAFNMTNARLMRFNELFKQLKPELIIGYVSALVEYAKFLEECKIRVSPPIAVCLTAEPSDVYQRKLIEKAFETKTYNQYGSSEILHIATECSHRSGLHIHADSRYVEIVDSNGKPLPVGTMGNIVVTDLENKVMPLIRYKNDDIGSFKKEHCSCGLNLPLMDNVAGRIYDMIVLKNGKKIYGHMFSRVLFRYVGYIKQFQVHQTSPDKIVVRIVPDRLEDFENLKHEIIVEFRTHTANLINYRFELVKHIEKEKSGKLRYVKSDVNDI